MSKKKIFRGYTEQEVLEMETGFYLFNFGGDFFTDNGHYLFTKKEISKIYRDTFKKVKNTIIDGSDKEKAYALDLIGKLIIQPMRLH